MTYEKIFDLKFKKGYSTNELIEKFPNEADKVRKIALLHLSTPILKKTLSEEGFLKKILDLKRRFFGS